MPALPRYQQIGVEYGGGTKGIDFPSRGEMTAGYNALANTLDQMSQSFFKEAATAAKEEGERYGAENAPTPEQIAEARRLNQPIEPIGDARTFFGKAAKEASARIAAKNVSVDAELELGKIQNDVAAGKIGANSITSRVNALAQGYTEALRQFDPLMARSVEADITLHGNKMFLAAQKKAMAEGVAAQALKTAEATEETYKNDIRNILTNGDQLLQGPTIDGKPATYTVQQQVDDAYTKVENRINSLPLKQRKELLKNLPQWAQTEVTSYINEKIVKAQSEDDLKPVYSDLKAGKFDAFFTANPDNRVTLMNSLGSQIHKFETQDTRADAGLRDLYSKLPANINASIAANKIINPNEIPADEQIDRAFRNNPERGNQIKAQIKESMEVYNAWQQFGYASETELDAERARLREAQAKAPLAEQAKIATTMSVFEKAYKARQQALEKDPAMFAMGLPEVRDTFREANDITNTPNISAESKQKAWGDYAQAMKTAQMHLGVPEADVKLLPKAFVDSVASNFDNQIRGGQDMAQWLASEKQKWGDEAWPMVMRQLNEKLPPATNVIASMLEQGQGIAASTLSQSLAKDQAKAIDDFFSGHKEDLKVIKETVSNEMKNFRATLSNSTVVDGVRVYEEWSGAVEQLAKNYVWSGQKPSDAAKRAYKEAIGSAYHFEPTYRIPAAVPNKDEIITNVGIVKQNLDRYDFEIPRTLSNAYRNWTPEMIKEEYYKSLASNGVFVNSKNEDKLRLIDGSGAPVRTKDGNFFEIGFNELMFEIPRRFDPTTARINILKGVKLPGER